MSAPYDGDNTARYQVTLPADVMSPRRARAIVAAQCAAWGLDGVSDDAAVIVSELVSNSVQHAATFIHLTLFAFSDLLRLEVSDQSPRPLRHETRSALAEGGRGLLLVDALAGHYGVVGGPEGKTVWAELSLLD